MGVGEHGRDSRESSWEGLEERKQYNSISIKTTIKYKNCKDSKSQAVVAHTFNPSTHKAEAGSLSWMETSMVYRASSRQLGLYRETILKNKWWKEIWPITEASFLNNGIKPSIKEAEQVIWLGCSLLLISTL